MSVSDFEMLDFATDCLGELIDKLHYAWVFVGGCGLLYIGLYLLDQFFGVFATMLFGEYNRGFHYLSAYLVGDTGDGALEYGRMLHQCILYFEGAYAVAR